MSRLIGLSNTSGSPYSHENSTLVVSWVESGDLKGDPNPQVISQVLLGGHVQVLNGLRGTAAMSAEARSIVLGSWRNGYDIVAFCLLSQQVAS